jgi:thiamine pyrophosphate-dependent acetolactate synthase large subunit-like protein
MDVATQIGQMLADLGADAVFGVVGSGNFHVTNALVASGARFVPSAHEAGSATAADSYARLTGKVGIVSVHQGPGVTNALTGVTEAAKSRTPLMVLAPEATNPRSNFYLDLAAMARSVGAAFCRVGAESPADDVAEAWRLATTGLGGTVVVGLPLNVQAAQAGPAGDAPQLPLPAAEMPDAAQVEQIAGLLAGAQRPVFIAGRGAARVPFEGTRSALEQLAETCGALLATSAAGHGLFAGSPWDLGISGGFATPLAADLIASADVLVAWGCSLNMWTTRHGTLIPPGAAVVRVDHDQVALDQPLIAPAAHDVRVRGELRLVAEAVLAASVASGGSGYRTADVRTRIESAGRWRQVAYDDWSTESTIDPRTLTTALDDILPVERVVAVDSGNFMGYPATYLRVPDPAGFSFTQAYQSIGLGLASAIGAAIARPDRLTVAALGDGGFLMALAELTTVRRLGLPLAIVVYNDAAYGAEVHHFGPDGFPLDTVRFADSDLAAIGRGFGFDGITVRSVADLEPLRSWVGGARDRAIVVDAKVAGNEASWWLAEAFRGH